MFAIRELLLGNTALAVLAESPKSPYNVDPVLVLTCIVVIMGLVVGAFALFYIFKRFCNSIQNKILHELEDIEAQTFKTMPPVTTPSVPPLTHSSPRNSALSKSAKTLSFPPIVEYNQAPLATHRPIRLLYPHPAPRVVPLLPTVPPPVHSCSFVYEPTSKRTSCIANISQGQLASIRHFTFESVANNFSMVADAVVGIYPISIVHPVVKTYEVHTYQLPHSLVLGSIINTLKPRPASVSASMTPERSIPLLSSPSTTPTVALTPPTPEKPSVVATRKITSTALMTVPLSPTTAKRRSLRAAEAGMHRFRKAKRYHGKENRTPVGHGAPGFR